MLLLICMDIHSNPGPVTSDPNGTSLDIFYLTARSIRNKLNDIYTTPDEHHILCFSEIHLDQSIASSSLVLDGFGLPVRKDRSQHGGGVMIYVSDLLFMKIEQIWGNRVLKPSGLKSHLNPRSF